MTNTPRREAQRAQLVQDGRKAAELVKTLPIADVLMLIGGSRARLYRAMHAAAFEAHVSDHTGCDPLLD